MWFLRIRVVLSNSQFSITIPRPPPPQVAHIAGYDDEHHLEKAPILEIDPIPEERVKSGSLQRLQVRVLPGLILMYLKRDVLVPNAVTVRKVLI